MFKGYSFKAIGYDLPKLVPVTSKLPLRGVGG